MSMQERKKRKYSLLITMCEILLSSRLPALIFEEVALDTRDIQEKPALDPPATSGSKLSPDVGKLGEECISIAKDSIQP
ncbi:hypothetical protein KY284_010594 [Solanum tuberosum]|nr:hypothetical protein KY284_010594 [Solanum tuberosum]